KHLSNAKHCILMGVVNITHDSFSDGGDFYQPNNALAQIDKLLEDGADVVDIGAESSRPNATPVGVEEERQRLIPILEYCSNHGFSAKVSIDTRHDANALFAAKEFGVGWVNNISGLYERATLSAMVRHDLKYIAMHMHGTPTTMQKA